eukprot:GFYU01003852.1.p1 GENE.GFYU01003852.1~~GFYU01003852.1.p1  ORF type:complete len:393 (-),score=148.17 GFYU01003852.1:225-1313(-)
MSAITQEWEGLLKQFQIPDNNVRKQAEEFIKQGTKTVACVEPLVANLLQSQDVTVRQLSAVLLRMKIPKLWTQLPEQVKATIKSTVLQQVIQEPESIVRKATCTFISVIGKFEVPNNSWPELMPMLFQMSQSPEETTREVGITLFSNLTDHIGDKLVQHFNDIVLLFSNGLRDQSSKVRAGTINGVSALIQWIEHEDQVASFRKLIDPILEAAQKSLVEGDEESAVSVLEIFSDILECEFVILTNIPVEFFLGISANTNLDMTTRAAALHIIAWAADNKPKTLIKSGKINEIIQVVLTVCSEEDDDGDDDDDENDQTMNDTQKSEDQSSAEGDDDDDDDDDDDEEEEEEGDDDDGDEEEVEV